MNQYTLTTMHGRALILAALAFVCAGEARALPVAPGVEGYGTDQPAGRGGQIYVVSNMNDSGSGSLRECVEASGPRICVFETSGAIRTKNDLEITSGNLTIAGQTAPSPGVWIQGAGIIIKNAQNILIQHITIAAGDDPDGPHPDDRDSLRIQGGSKNIVIDHITLLWGGDETGSIWAWGSSDVPSDITISNSIVAEALHYNTMAESRSAKGFIVGAAPGSPEPRNISFVGNLFANNFERNPYVTDAVLVNNLIYNYQWRGIDLRGDNGKTGRGEFSVVGNVFVRGPNTGSSPNAPITLNNLSNDSQVYLEDNHATWLQNADDWQDLVQSRQNPANPETVRSNTRPFWPSGLLAYSSKDVKSRVVANAGSRPNDRDATAARIVADVLNGGGQFRNCVVNCTLGDSSPPGGWPTIAQNRHNLSIPGNPGGDNDNDGYTNVEEWLHAQARIVESIRPNPPAQFGKP